MESAAATQTGSMRPRCGYADRKHGTPLLLQMCQMKSEKLQLLLLLRCQLDGRTYVPRGRHLPRLLLLRRLLRGRHHVGRRHHVWRTLLLLLCRDHVGGAGRGSSRHHAQAGLCRHCPGDDTLRPGDHALCRHHPSARRLLLRLRNGLWALGASHRLCMCC